MWSWYQYHSQCSAEPEIYLYFFKTRSQRSWNRWSDRASLNQYSQEESLMYLQWCGREWRTATLRGLEIAYQWQGDGWVLPNNRHGDNLPQPKWGLIIWQSWLLRCLLSNWAWRRDKRYMHNQHISGTVQDVPTTSGIEKLFFNLPELHRINTQRNQRCCDLSRRCVALCNYQGAIRHENACSQESTTWEKFYSYWEKV